MENQLQALYGKLANHISSMIPIDWTEVYFLGDMGRGEMITAIFFFKGLGDEEFVRSPDIPERYNVSKDIYNELRYDVYSMLQEMQQCFKDDEQELWDQITLKLNSDGKFKVDFHYGVITDDEDDSPLKRELIWAYETFGDIPEDSYLRKIVEEHIQGKETEKRKNSPANESKASEEVEARTSNGWDAIAEHFKKIYPEQTDPKHYRPLISPMFGNFDTPLFGIDVYDGGDFWHFLTYGFSDVYDELKEETEWSDFGFELTLKLKKTTEMNDPQVEENELKNISAVLQDLGKYVFDSGKGFSPYQYIYSQQTEGFDYEKVSKLTGFATIADEAGIIETPNGKVQFLCIVGLTDKELRSIYDGVHTTEEILNLLETDLTDFERNDLI